MAKKRTQDDLLGGCDEPDETNAEAEEPQAEDLVPGEEAGAADLFGDAGPTKPATPVPESYVVLARRYRPRTFDEIVGQEHVENALRGAIESKQVAHAYLFSGPRGTGKTSTARILAKALNCQAGGPRPDPCGKCDSCRGITAGSSLDVIEIDAASNTGVDNIRDLRTGVVLAPFSRYKVYIVDEVHMLSMQAFNALLKTLEEPPAQVIFVLATTELQKVPETIVSRCQAFQFRRFSNGEIARQLDKILEVELKRRNLTVDAEDRARVLELIARNAQGGMRDAQVALDQVLVMSREKIVFEDVSRFLGSVRSDLLDRFVDGLHGRRTEELLLLIDEMVNGGQDLLLFVRHLVDHIRSLMIARTAPNRPELIDVSDDRRKALFALAEKLPTAFLINASSAFLKLDEEIKTSTQGRFLLEYTVIRLTQIDVVEDLSRIIGRIQKLERLLAAGGGEVQAPARGPAAAPEASTAGRKHPPARFEAETATIEAPPTVVPVEPGAGSFAEAAPSPLQTTEVPQVVPAQPRDVPPDVFMRELRELTVSKNHFLHISLLEASLVSLTESGIVLGVNPSDRFTHDHLNRPQNQQIIREVARQITGRDMGLRVQFVAMPATTAEAPGAVAIVPETASPEPATGTLDANAEAEEAFEETAGVISNETEPQEYRYVPNVLKGELLASFLEKHEDIREVFQKVKRVFNIPDSQISFRMKTS